VITVEDLLQFIVIISEGNKSSFQSESTSLNITPLLGRDNMFIRIINVCRSVSIDRITINVVADI
jgi:hypothetical protein